MIKFTQIITLLSMSIILHSCTSYTTVRQHPEFFSGTRPINSILILPPEVNMYLLTFNGNNKQLWDEEVKAQKDLISQLSDTLSAHGYRPTFLDITSDNGRSKDLPFKYEMVKMANGYQLTMMYYNLLLDEATAYNTQNSIGPLVNHLSHHNSADAILLVNYIGFEKSDGLMAKEIIQSTIQSILAVWPIIPYDSFAATVVTLIDGVNGDILWSNTYAGTESANTIINTVLEPFPKRK